MSLIDRILGKEEEMPEQPNSAKERIIGRIIKLKNDEGWGFISSKAIPFTRIFFHWSALNQDTLKFPDLKRGMEVEFEPLELENKGIRAIKISVLDEEEDNEA